jgi:IS30 family transposase
MYYNQLNSEQRYAISILLQNGKSKKEIANAINVHISTIYRELKRNSGKYQYHHRQAQKKCDERKNRMCRDRKFDLQMRKRIFSFLLNEEWSPEQISGYLRRRGEPYVSAETIYQYIRFDRKCGGSLWKSCRHKLKHRHKILTGNGVRIKDRVSIEDRPNQANGARLGDWEMDCISGKENKTHIVTLVERSTTFMLMRKLKYGKNANQLAKTVASMLLPYKKFVLTITTDNGLEFTEHKYIAKMLDTKIFFAHPYCSWEKVTIENTNKLIRQYIPKKLDFNEITDTEITQVQYKINRRPRKKLNFIDPKSAFFKNIRNFALAT